MMNSFYKPFVTLFFILSSFYLCFGQTKEKLDDCPLELEITSLESCGDYQFSLGEGQPNEDVYWYFDDGTYDDHVAHTIVHHYVNQGSYAGYAQYTSDLCSTTTYNFFLIVPSCDNTAIKENELSQILVYPNPAKDYLFLNNIDNKKVESLRIINQFGEIVYERNDIRNEISKINLGDYSNGFYQLVLYMKHDVRLVSFHILH